MTERKKVGVVLFQLGGPDTPGAVEPFLRNLFSDPDIIELPLGGLLRRPLAWWMARRRAPHVREAYAEIGGGSPLLELTERQARALEQALAPETEARVFLAMRYWHPFTAEAVRRLRAFSPETVVLLPLYPQYSFATTGSSLNEWRRCWGDSRAPVKVVEDFHDHPLFLDAVTQQIVATLEEGGCSSRPVPAGCAGTDVRPCSSRPVPAGSAGTDVRLSEPSPSATSLSETHLIFSAHGLPVSFIARGDPYQRQVEETVARVTERLAARLGAAPAHAWCYQSKVGRQRWLEPSLDETVERLAGEGVRRMLVVPIAFVSEHIETLHEIAIQTRRKALALGVERFELMPALNDAPRFIAALKDLVLRALRSAGPSLRSG
jgi:ferrochelatase